VEEIAEPLRRSAEEVMGDEAENPVKGVAEVTIAGSEVCRKGGAAA